jgi:hypothetical protein
MWHFCEWQLHGLHEDYLAWKGLSGQLGKEEIILEMCSKGSNDMWSRLDSQARAIRCAKGGQAASLSMTTEQKARRSQLGGKKGSTNTNSQLYIDPLHPELGSRNAGVLVRMQKSRGYPSTKENRLRVQ